MRRIRWLAIVAAGLLVVGCAPRTPGYDVLKGQWERSDGGYVIAITSVADTGALGVSYFNPRPIHVGQASAAREAGQLRVTIVLQDANYPGSTYRLIFDPAADQLKGTYYQAVTRETYAVVFARLKS